MREEGTKRRRPFLSSPPLGEGTRGTMEEGTRQAGESGQETVQNASGSSSANPASTFLLRSVVIHQMLNGIDPPRLITPGMMT
jgi:hypothetical protein